MTPRTHTGQQLAKAIAADYDRALLPDWPDPTGLVLAIETEAAGAALAALRAQVKALPEEDCFVGHSVVARTAVLALLSGAAPAAGEE